MSKEIFLLAAKRFPALQEKDHADAQNYRKVEHKRDDLECFSAHIIPSSFILVEQITHS